MQTVLGANGAVGPLVAKNLSDYTDQIRLVSRNPKKVNDKDVLHPADLTKREEVFNAIQGSEVVYLTVGFEYNIKVWRSLWPALMRNVLDACEEYGSKLVFFDNIYAIGKQHIHHITEDCPISPCSKKGEVRAEVDKMVLDAMDKGKVPSIIARCADFYSTMTGTSMLMIMVYENLVKGKKAQWFRNAHAKHSMTYCPDAALGTAMLGNTSSAFNQIWNLPTDSEALTGEEWVKLFAQVMGTSDKYQALPGWGIGALGIFMPIMKELNEMSYQFALDYFFDSSKFNQAFNYTPTSNEAGVRQTVEALRAKTA
jgi:nucleoside-diphosphate-sugar epimerase